MIQSSPDFQHSSGSDRVRSCRKISESFSLTGTNSPGKRPSSVCTVLNGFALLFSLHLFFLAEIILFLRTIQTFAIKILSRRCYHAAHRRRCSYDITIHLPFFFEPILSTFPFLCRLERFLSIVRTETPISFAICSCVYSP